MVSERGSVWGLWGSGSFIPWFDLYFDSGFGLGVDVGRGC